jgi:hypothetical protein
MPKYIRYKRITFPALKLLKVKRSKSKKQQEVAHGVSPPLADVVMFW